MREMAELPKAGDRVPVEKFHVSEMNANFGEPFGESEEDEQLIANLRAGGELVHKIIARPENEGYGVVVGRRRFLAKREIGTKFLEVGKDCLIEEIGDEEAAEASVIENFFRKDMNPIARAKAFNRVIAFSPGGLRATARRFGIPPTTLSDYMRPLDLTPKMQEEVAKGSLIYTDAVRLARMKLGEVRLDQLAEILENEGYEAFLKEVERSSTGKLKRGIPKGVYDVDRVVWDKRSRREMGIRETISKATKAKGFKKEPEYIKDFLIRHIEEIEQELKA